MISNYNVVGENAVFAWKGPTGSIIAVQQEVINSAGGFSNTITFGDSHWEDGTYTLKVIVGEYNAEKTFQVIIPPPPTAPENVVQNAQGSSTPGCEPDCFIPNTITINPGEMVTFQNSDNAAHTSTAGSPQDGPSGVWDSSMVMMGTSFTTPALSEGTYPYFCMVHPWMVGTVIVGEGGAQTTSEEASQAEAEAAERIAAAEAAAAAAEAEAAAAAAEAEARIAEAEAAARIAEAEAAAKASEEAALAAEKESQERIAATASVNEKIEISMDFTNDTDVQQSFALIVQIKDSNNTTISLSHVTGMLGAGQTLDQILSYTPTEAGTYTVEKFLWDNFADPTALTDEKETFTLTVS
jgi:plastocyanin